MKEDDGDVSGAQDDGKSVNTTWSFAQDTV
jgi:hypothetical protein